MVAPTIHAEMTASGDSFAFVIVGNAWDQREAGIAMSQMTPDIKFPGGGVQLAKLTWPAIVQFSATFNGRGGNGWWVPGPKLKEWAKQEYARRTSSNGLPPMEWTGTDGRTPRQYQLDGAAQIARIGRYFLYDEPGLGKTMETIVGLAWRAASGISVLPIIVVAPSWGICNAWADEIALWQPEWRTVMWGGIKRRELAGTADVYLTTYATARRDGDDYGPLMKLKAATFIADEAHFLKNSKAKQSYACGRLGRKAPNVVLLTGTPIVQDTEDLWRAFDIKDPGAWPAAKPWTDRYCTRHDEEYQVVVDGLNRFMKPEFYATILGTWRRVAKADVLDLPPKVYSTRRVEIPEPWATAYKTMERDMLAMLPDGDEIPVMDLLAQLTRLSQLSSSAADVEIEMVYNEKTEEDEEKYIVTPKAPSWKVDELLEILAERPGQPVLCFARHRQLIEIAGAAAEAAGCRVGYITGKVPQKKRAAYIAAFQRGELDLMCATAAAGGSGITLTAAGTVVFLQRPQSLAESIQAEDRAQRIGSEHHEMIEIIDIMAVINGKKTIDQRTRELLINKGGQLAEFLKDRRIVDSLLGGEG